MLINARARLSCPSRGGHDREMELRGFAQKKCKAFGLLGRNRGVGRRDGGCHCCSAGIIFQCVLAHLRRDEKGLLRHRVDVLGYLARCLYQAELPLRQAAEGGALTVQLLHPGAMALLLLGDVQQVLHRL